MAPYVPIYVSRSDAKLEAISSKSRRKEPNEPTAAQLDNTPDAKGISDYYKYLDVGDSKEVDWRRKLGGLLMKEIGGKEQIGKSYRGHPSKGNQVDETVDKNYILAALPENYRLYEHVKFTTSEITGEFLVSTIHDSNIPDVPQDAYLYGHPQGRKKRYRSPGDFFPHLLWLATDESGDPDNCSCKICAPDEIQVFDKPGKIKAETVMKEEMPVKRDNVPIKNPNFNTNPIVVVPRRSLSHETMSRPIPKPVPSPAIPPAAPRVTTPRVTAPPVISPSFLAPSKCFEQDQDAQYAKYLFRTGELVWFNRGNAWGLSVIVKRDVFKDQRHQDRPKYLVQPLSHPFSHPPVKIIAQEELLRPWLAWSAPAPTHQSLGAAGLTYSTIDWKAVIDGRYGLGDAEVDGSIFAAKAIDESFTLIEPLSNNTVTTGERFYNGVFFGGEKVWVGEPIRLRIGNGQDIMVVHHIVERLKPNSTNASSAIISVVGDIYRFLTIPIPHDYKPPDTRHLPTRLRQDLDYRNRTTIPTKRTVSEWKIVQAQTRLGLVDLKGRWYESSILLPILRGAADFTRDLRLGEINDVGHWMNGRGDSSGTVGVASKPGTRHFDRLEAFGKAVPTGTRVSRGLDGPAEENIFPVEAALGGGTGMGQSQEGEEGSQVNVAQAADGDIGEFMDLDRMEEGYVQQYVEGGGQFFER